MATSDCSKIKNEHTQFVKVRQSIQEEQTKVGILRGTGNKAVDGVMATIGNIKAWLEKTGKGKLANFAV